MTLTQKQANRTQAEFLEFRPVLRTIGKCKVPSDMILEQVHLTPGFDSDLLGEQDSVQSYLRFNTQLCNSTNERFGLLGVAFFLSFTELEDETKCKHVVNEFFQVKQKSFYFVCISLTSFDRLLKLLYSFEDLRTK